MFAGGEAPQMDLQRAIQLALEGRAVLFTGAGFALGATNVNGGQFRSGRELAKHFSKAVGLADDTPLDAAAEEFAHQEGVDRLISYLKAEFTASSVQPYHAEIARVPWRRVYTTNYDNVLELAHAQVSRKITPVTSSNSIKKTPKDGLAVHLNGYVDSLDRDTIWNDFKLTETSYASSALSSPWVDLFRHDLAQASAVFFLGYSIADLDIKRILFDTPELRSKTFFVLGLTPDAVTHRRASTYGTVVSTTTGALAELIEQERGQYDAASAPAPLGNSIKRVENPTDWGRFSDAFVFDLMAQGQVRPEFVAASMTGGEHYFLERKAAADVVALAKECATTIIVHSELGNGKSLLVEGVMQRVAETGRPVYLVHKRTDDLFKELDTVLAASPPALLVIDGYADWMDVAEYVGLNANPALSLLLSARTNTHDVRVDDLLAQLHRDRVSEFGIDLLHEKDIRWVDESLARYGLWGDKTSWAPQRRTDYLKSKCGSEFSGILLTVLRSPEISRRFESLLGAIQGHRDHYEVIVTVLVLTVLQYPVSIDVLIDIWGDRITDTNFRNDPAVREVCDTVHGHITMRSAVAAQHLLQRVADSGVVVDTLEHIARISDRNSGIHPFDGLMKSLMRFSDLQTVLPEQNRRSNVLRYYESVKSLGAARRNPHFWLQYAIAAMVIEDYERASKYFETAYSLAEERDRYDPFMIDNHFARFLLKTAPLKTDVTEALEAFRRARGIIQHQIQRERFHYPFRVATAYVEFFDTFETKLTLEQKQEVARAALYVNERIEHLPEFRRRQRYVRQCAETMTGLVRRVFGETHVVAPHQVALSPDSTSAVDERRSAGQAETDEASLTSHIVKILKQRGDPDGWMFLGTLGSSLRSVIPGFHHARFGAGSLRQLISRLGTFEIQERSDGQHSHTYIRTKKRT
jgi:tetratricopeptide (TPR) repeat protein